MPVFGVDLSDFDRGRGPVDVAAMARDGVQFLTHKATEGTTVQHAYYGQTLNAGRAAGIPFVGAYFVPRTPGNNGHGSIQAQVAFFLAYLDAQTPWWRNDPEFFIQVDTEHWSNQNGVYDAVAPQYGAFACALLRAQTGKWVIHYAPRWAYGDTIGGGEPLWASSYGTNPAVPYRDAYPGDGASGWAPYSGRTPTFLQFGSRLTIGSQPTCDANAYRGTVDQLRALITGGQTMANTKAERIIEAMAGGFEKTSEGEPVGPVSWVKIQGAQLNNIEGAVNGLTTAVGKIMAAQGAEQADIDALLARPALTLDTDQVTQLRDGIAAVLVARPDTPLGEADIPTIQAAIDRYIRTHFGQPAQADAPAQG